MSKSDNGAIVGQIIKGAVTLIGTVVMGFLSAKKGKKKHDSWKRKKNS